MKLVEIVFDIPLERSFFYLYEKEINNFVRVLTPLGKKNRKGFAINVKDTEKENDFKFIKKVYDESPLINNEDFEFFKIIARRYCISLGQVIFSIIGNLPLKHCKKKLEIEKTLSTQLFQKFEKKIYLYQSKEEKLEFYIDLIKQTNGSLLFLFPEISIIEDYYQMIEGKVEKKVLKYYGEMKKKERMERYLEILNNKNLIVIGSRISVFLPFLDLSAIIVDSYIDSSYREKKHPKYNAVDVAEERCKFLNIPLILTSHTLSINDYFEVKNKKITLFDKRSFEGTPEIFILDKKWEQIDKNLDFLTKFSVSMLEETILKGKKVGIIHNRKGNWKTFKCDNCDHVLRCKECSSILILNEENKLYCKYCRTSENFVKKCPNCRSKNIIERIIGIEKMYRKLKDVYPDFKIQKFTAEEKNIEKESDIIVGSSVLKNILDIFDFGLIIFPHAESFFNIPEYNSEEIFFFIVNEFICRLKNKNAKIIIQTKNPNFEIFTFFKTKKYEIFYEKELKTREILGYPPFSDIIAIEIPVKRSPTFENRVNLLRDIIERNKFEILFSDITNGRKNKKFFKIIFKLKKDEKLPYDEIMALKEKIDFKIEFNPLII
ncbi:MAG: primosomal protein N' [Candidatus Omnitrophica bacterium]|nr:primosomal protein N' [Candidatus Omnitrophota bacterium]MCM8802075.1 primosomal protein N' [Candidatus Omnitrophota bacterium]